jgi:hypothetical protein
VWTSTRISASGADDEGATLACGALRSRCSWSPPLRSSCSALFRGGVDAPRAVSSLGSFHEHSAGGGELLIRAAPPSHRLGEMRAYPRTGPVS